MSSAKDLLACALTYREAEERTSRIDQQFDTEDAAVQVFTQVLLHEAKHSLADAIQPPENPYLFPVDIDTGEPGIVDTKDELHVLRGTSDMTRIKYRRQTETPKEAVEEALPPCINVSLEAASAAAEKERTRVLRREERKAETAARNERKREEQKEERARETDEERRERIEETKRKREERKAKRVEEPVTEKPPRPTAPPTSEDTILVPDHSALPKMGRTRKRGVKATFFESPVPHHRHLYGLQRASLSSVLASSVLKAVPSDALEIISGPPGTGKTSVLVGRIPEHGRVLLCAPTNVGAVHLFLKCLDRFPEETSLVLPPQRIPPGTPLVSNDPTKRIVCCTVSSRSGRFLDTQRFENVFLDEAAQCMEAWAWTLLRPEVRRVCMAGDVKQLPALVCESGVRLGHERSLMGRLLECDYPTTLLRVQNRMAPQIMELANRLSYDGELTCGPHAPVSGQVRWVAVESTETSCDHSFVNREEAEVVSELVTELGHECVVLSPYAAQCRHLLSKKMGVQVHTVDSFQGRESDAVILSVVRTGDDGMGFWEDARRVVVALTRARTTLILVHSPKITGLVRSIMPA